MAIELIVAMTANRVIGRDGALPWRLSTDLRRFKALTMGKTIVMGRRTWESIGRALPGRRNVVVTRRAGYVAEGAEAVSSLAAAIALARRDDAKADVCIVGGGQIYRQALAQADRLHVTHIHARLDGDAHFPAIDPQVWKAVSREEVPAGEKDTHPTSYVIYERRPAA